MAIQGRWTCEEYWVGIITVEFLHSLESDVIDWVLDRVDKRMNITAKYLPNIGILRNFDVKRKSSISNKQMITLPPMVAEGSKELMPRKLGDMQRRTKGLSNKERNKDFQPFSSSSSLSENQLCCWGSYFLAFVSARIQGIALMFLLCVLKLW